MQQGDISCVAVDNFWKLFSQLQHIFGYRSHIKGWNTFGEYSLATGGMFPGQQSGTFIVRGIPNMFLNSDSMHTPTQFLHISGVSVVKLKNINKK